MGGHQFRTLETAEELMATDPDAAWDYLTELYETAEAEDDTETRLTCEWYMRRLPDGNNAFPHWLKHRHDPPPEDDEAEQGNGSEA